MSLWEFIQANQPVTLLSGLLGAAAMAATDWRSPWRVLQHIFVGTSTSAMATPVFAPLISKVLGFVAVDPSAHDNASAFVVGAFGIYVLEFGLALWKSKTKQADKDQGE